MKTPVWNTLFSSTRCRWLAAGLGGLTLAVAALAVYPTAEPADRYDPSVPPPKDATVLFDGRSLSGWTKRGSSEPATWKVENGYMQAGGGDVQTKETFRDFQLHVEFWIPHMPNARGQARGNSGVYMQGRYEVQVLDSYGLEPGLGDCGAIYGQYVPMVNACRPPERWQSYDIFYTAPRFDSEGKMTARPRMSVLQNGIWIHHDREIQGGTTAGVADAPDRPGPILLQDHGNPVRYRNIWIRRLGDRQREEKPA
jgi:hypothetical protein